MVRTAFAWKYRSSIAGCSCRSWPRNRWCQRRTTTTSGKPILIEHTERRKGGTRNGIRAAHPHELAGPVVV